MPLYTFQCPTCDASKDVYRKVRNIEDQEICEKCMEIMQRRITMPAKQKPYTPRLHPQLGASFRSLSEEKQAAKKMGLTDITGEVKAMKRGQSKWEKKKTCSW